MAGTAEEIDPLLEHVPLRPGLAVRRDLEHEPVDDLVVRHADVQAVDAHVGPRLQRHGPRVVDDEAGEDRRARLRLSEPLIVRRVVGDDAAHRRSDFLEAAAVFADALAGTLRLLRRLRRENRAADRQRGGCEPQPGPDVSSRHERTLI